MSFANYWNSSVKKLIKPAQVLGSIIALCRVSAKNLLDLPQVTINQGTIACGEQFVITAVPAEAITTTVVRLPEGLDAVRYRVSGLPEGVVAFSGSPDGDAALKYINFYEDDQGYVFVNNPTIYGVVNDRGSAHCTFCLCIGSPTTVGLQDPHNLYDGALSDSAVSAVHDCDRSRSMTCGLGGKTLAAVCGATTADTAGAVTEWWSEGSDLYGICNNQLLKASGKASKPPMTYIASGGTLVSELSDFCVITAKDGLESCWVESVEQLPYKFIEDYPLLSAAKNIDELSKILQYYNQYTYDSTGSKADPGTQRLLKKQLTLPSCVHVTQRICVKAPEKAVDECLEIAIVCSNENEIAEISESDTSANSLLLQLSRTCSVVRIKHIDRRADGLYGITDNAEFISSPIHAGQYISYVLLIGTLKNSTGGVILTKLRTRGEVVRAGESVAVKIEVGD